MSIFGIGQAVGLEVGKKTIRAAGVKKSRGGMPEAQWLSELALPKGLVLNSFTEPNITDVPEFAGYLRKLLGLSGHGGGRLNVALPDYVSRVYVLDYDMLQAKKDETEQMIKWRLKKLLPIDIDQAALRYQYLGKFRTGDKDQHRFLVSIIKADILAQYEQAFKEAGVKADRIEISTFALWNLFEGYITRSAGGPSSFALMNISGGRLTVIVFDCGVPHFLRLKDLGGFEPQSEEVDPIRVLRELTASLTYYKENFAETEVRTVFITGDAAGLGVIAAGIEGNSELKAEVLNFEKAISRGGGISIDADALHAFGAACGAASGA